MLNATVLDANGGNLGSRDVRWAVENGAVATISAQGILTAVAPGKTQVAASKGGKSALAPVTVSALPPALVRVIPTSATVLVSGTTPLAAEVRDAGGGILTGHVITWSSASPGIASVNANGVVTGVTVGNVAVTASGAGLSGTAVVTVRPIPVASVTVAPSTGTLQIGQTLQLSVSLRDSLGRILTGRTISYASSSLTTATVSSAGLVRAIAKGTATITTSSEGKTATASVTVP